jgi:hypothetical protein
MTTFKKLPTRVPYKPASKMGSHGNIDQRRESNVNLMVMVFFQVAVKLPINA